MHWPDKRSRAAAYQAHPQLPAHRFDLQNFRNENIIT
jgi:hypothetical protein